MVIALLICIFIIEIYIYKKSDKKYVSPQGYDYIVTFKDVEVGDKMLDQHIQEVFKCRRNGKVYRERTDLLKQDLQLFLANELHLDPNNIEVMDTKPYLSYIKF